VDGVGADYGVETFVLFNLGVDSGVISGDADVVTVGEVEDVVAGGADGHASPPSMNESPSAFGTHGFEVGFDEDVGVVHRRIKKRTRMIRTSSRKPPPM
jgi:hypothetical protein